MTYEEWCQHHPAVIADADKYNKFASTAKFILLTNIGPRIARLGRKMYSGCGFHYGMEQSFGKLVVALSWRWQPSANWCRNVEEDGMTAIVNKVLYTCLLRDVNRAERSAWKGA